MALNARQRQTFLWTTVGLAFVALLYWLGPVLTPFVLGGVLAYMLEPAVSWLNARRVPRVLAVLLVIVLLVAIFVVLVLLIVPVLQSEISALRGKLPAFVELLNTRVVPRVNEMLGTKLSLDVSSVKTFLSEQMSDDQLTQRVIGTIRSGTSAVLGVLGLLFIVPVVLFFLLLDWPQFIQAARRLIPRPLEARVMAMLDEINQVLSQFLRGQISVMLILAVYYSVGLAIAGFDVALPVGILTGLLVFIPYLGFGLGLVLALLSALLQFDGWMGLIAVGVVYGIGQALESFILTPKLVGGSIGLHPLAVIFVLMAFGQVFGFVGVLVALPVSAVLVVALRVVLRRYLASPVYTGY
ncbi:MAG TPA: AI-2E family transporter [Burkholderiaceae bacterium]|nr:AI-2E family transporter [Burkholderiaceae bacterium]